MNDEIPKYWILNQLNTTFTTIPKKRMGLTNDPVFMKEDDFLLGDLGWIPRRNSFLKYITNKIDISNEKQKQKQKQKSKITKPQVVELGWAIHDSYYNKYNKNLKSLHK